MAVRFCQPTPIVNDLSKVQLPENVVEMDPPPYESLFNNTNTNDSVQYQPQLVPTNNGQSQQPLIDHTQLTQIETVDEINSYLFWSILNIIFCCCTLGCIVCCFSMKTKTLRKQGNIPGALKASNAARKLNICTTALGIFMIMIQVLYYINKH